MTENELTRALAEYDASAPLPDPRQLAARILQRDQRRVKTLAVLSLVLWLVAAGGLAFLGHAISESWGNYLYIRWYEGRQGADERLRAERMRAIHHRHIDDIVEWAIYALIVCPVAIGLASAVTLALVFSSRGATLRQVNANLVAICGQLKALRQTPAGPAIPSG